MFQKLAIQMMRLSDDNRSIRVSLMRELVDQYWKSGCSRCKKHMAFQIALSCRTGFGQSCSHEQSVIWLERSGKSMDELELEFNAAKCLLVPPYYKNPYMPHAQFAQFCPNLGHAYEYRMDKGVDFASLEAELREEAKDIGDSFGETHEMTINLKLALARLLDNYGKYKEAAAIRESLSKWLKRESEDQRVDVLSYLCDTYTAQGHLELAERGRLKIADYYREQKGEEHMSTLQSLARLVSTQKESGRCDEAERTLLRVIAIQSRLAGDEHPKTLSAKFSLVSVYVEQGRLVEAENLQSQVLKARLKTLGKDHKSTWYCMSNLATIKLMQGHVKDAEERELEVLNLRTKFLGSDHPDTLISKHNIGLIYGKSNRFEEEESMLKQVYDARKIVFGAAHRDTIRTATSLVENYRKQGLFKEAHHLQTDIVRVRTEELGTSHPLTLASRTRLMWTLNDQRFWHQAEATQIETIAEGKNQRGETDESVLKCMSALASLYKVQNRLMESLTLYEQVLSLRAESLGKNHCDTCKTARDIEAVKKLQLLIEEEG